MIPNVRTLNCALNLACKNKKHKYSVNIFKFYCKLYCKFNHRRTGLEIFGKGGEHEFSQLVPKARERLGASGGMLRRENFENRFLRFGVGFMHKTSDK